ncbi:MAG: DEAD/DEAH box helicase [Verrucomicrobiota bacterium]|nr:DEAD/DEAH box helicase [Verrucomicrobiota bacterium]
MPVTQQPEFVTRYRERLSDCKQIGEPLFSRGTYQLEMAEGEERFFPFLQLGEDGSVTDAFCSCSISETGKGCPHLAAAWLFLVPKRVPLHVRWRDSFWNGCCQIAAKRHGDTLPFEVQEKEWALFSKTRKKLFSCTPLTEQAEERWKELISPVKKETEETSLKFSNWSFEEMAAFKEGRGSFAISYEFSPWSDLSKWLFSLQEQGKPYRVHFPEKEAEVLPYSVQIEFEELHLWLYLAEVSWSVLIPRLTTLNASLKLLGREDRAILGAEYDAKKRRLFLHRQSVEKRAEEIQGVPVGEWRFISGKGFVHCEETVPLQGEIEEKKIGGLLSAEARELSSFLPISSAGHKARYLLHFDAADQLHIEAFLFEPGDLRNAALFFPWIYLEEKGFLLVEEWLFDEKEKIIAKEEMADFINRHRVWLHNFPGFQIHLGSLESHLIYRIAEDKRLVFEAELAFPERYEGARHFEDWVFLPGFGFYQKREQAGHLPLHPGLSVAREEVSDFITLHREELEQVQGFFASSSPLEELRLQVSLDAEGRIQTNPQRVYRPGVDPAQVAHFGAWLFLPGEGFSEVPSGMQLPERFREPVTILPAQEGAFLSYELETLRSYSLEIDPRLCKPSSLVLKVRKVLPSRKEHEWLLHLFYESEIGPVDPVALWDAQQKKREYLFSSAGLLFLKEPRFQWLRHLSKKQIDRKKGVIRLSALEWLRLTLFETVLEPKGDDPEAVASRKLLEQFSRFETDRILDLSTLKSELRPYQEQGVAWLWFLYCHKLSGLLCDDMGLGKTHQAMALLSAISAYNAGQGKKYLVVCPTSVLYHWEDLLTRFLPTMRVLAYHGLTRSLENFSEDYDLLLTSYGLLRTGREDLTSFSFELAIFDEVQVAKNRSSQTHRALSSLRASMRLGLTGTPLENQLKELKALFDLVLPAYLPSDSLFRDLFIHPIEKEGDEETKKLLGKLIRPLLLRRKKKDVLTDLPEKIEEIAYAELSPEQRDLYAQVALQVKSGVYTELLNEGEPIPYLHVFAALSLFKQICDHPALYHKSGSFEGHASGKWDLFVELLTEAMESGQKVVVFSQYLEMIALIESYLKKEKIGYASIKGSTRNRREELLRFKEDPGCKVFVASLLAAGVGIDLTTASIVIHYDRWWNPAKENQATDRVHRIGQNRGVQVFKLVTRGTVEEEIHALIERKKGLFESVIGVEDQINYLSRDELIKLFERMFSDCNV